MDQLNDGHALQRLLDELGRLPGIGPKSAQRIAYYLLEADAEEARRLATAILEVKQQVHFCPICFSYATRDTCDVCSDASRDRTTICVVSEPRDVSAIERTGSYHGLYHVLGGVISPMDKIGPEQLHVKELLSRLASGESRRSFSPPTRTLRARQPPHTSRGSSAPWACACLVLPAVCRLAGTWSMPTR